MVIPVGGPLMVIPGGGPLMEPEPPPGRPGIPPALRERVFDRFQRLETHRGSPGVGLGLSLVRAIVHRHGGRIALLDSAPGLRVRVILPVATPPA